MVTSTLAAIGVSTSGLLVAVVAAVAETTAPASGTSNLASYVQGGGSAAAVAGLVYVARLIVTGALVPRPVKDTETELNAAILAAAQREDRVLKVAEDTAQQHKRLEQKHDDALLLLADVRRSLSDVEQEMQYWREMRDRGTRREDRGPDHRAPGRTP